MRKITWTLPAIMTAWVACAQPSDVKFTSQNNADFTRTITDKNVQLVDVRTPDEYAAGHIPGAIPMNVLSPEFDAQIARLDKSRPVAVYCRSGVRSKTAAKKLSGQGFRVFELDRGMGGWDGEVTPE